MWATFTGSLKVSQTAGTRKGLCNPDRVQHRLRRESSQDYLDGQFPRVHPDRLAKGRCNALRSARELAERLRIIDFPGDPWPEHNGVIYCNKRELPPQDYPGTVKEWKQDQRDNAEAEEAVDEHACRALPAPKRSPRHGVVGVLRRRARRPGTAGRRSRRRGPRAGRGRAAVRPRRSTGPARVLPTELAAACWGTLSFIAHVIRLASPTGTARSIL